MLAATVASINARGPSAGVLVTGDLIDSAQRNELDWALALLAGGTSRPDSGAAAATQGVQAASNPDPLYYRPDVDAPRHPELLASRARAGALGRACEAPWWPVLGNHDILVRASSRRRAATAPSATGDRLLRHAGARPHAARPRRPSRRARRSTRCCARDYPATRCASRPTRAACTCRRPTPWLGCAPPRRAPRADGAWTTSSTSGNALRVDRARPRLAATRARTAW